MDTNSFIQDLAVILVAVGSVSILFSRLGWPKVIGYILAGVILGKYTFGGSFVINEGSIEVLGQIGVVFLMLTLGLEFSLRKLKRIGHVIFPTAVIDMAVMIWAGHFIGTKLLGWGTVQSLFLGVAISDSATTLLAKTINEMGWGTRRFTKYIFGITISEDILCIGVIALLAGVAKTGSMRIGDLVYSLGGLVLFLTGVIVFGLLLVPRLLNQVARLKDDESLLLAMLSCCFLVSLIAARLDFSLALGAFLVGVMAAESEPLKRVYQQCVPLRTMFSAIFFVTIGLLIDPRQMLSHSPMILVLTLVVVVGKSVNCTVGALLTGQDIKNAIQTGVGLAQIGEFAYLVALIGLRMKVVDASLYQIAVGVSVLTTVLNPFLMRASDPFSDWIENRLPVRWKENLDTYAKWTERFWHRPASSAVERSLRYNLILALLQLSMVAVVFLGAGMMARLDLSRISPLVETNKEPLLWVLACLLTVPNAIFLFFRARLLGETVVDSLVPLKVAQTAWALSFRRFTRLGFAVAAITVLFFEATLLSGTIMPEQGWARLLMAITLVLVAFFGWKRFRRLGAESLQTLREVLTKETEANPHESAADLLDIHTERMRVVPGSEGSGKSLREVNLRATTGASVIGIERGGRTIVNPSANDVMQTGDVLLVLGDDRQLARTRKIVAVGPVADPT